MAACGSVDDEAAASADIRDVGGGAETGGFVLDFSKDTQAGSPDTVATDLGPAEPDVPDVAEVPDTPAPDATEPVDLGPPPDLGCVPACVGKTCGPDGCGDICGTCGEKQVCGGGKCETDPSLGCEGLDLAENWKGEFEGDVTFSAVSLIPIDASTSGDMEFSITCFNSKLIVKGTMAGEASGNKFTLTMSGSYEPSTKKLNIKLLDGDVTVWGVIRYVFAGECPGELTAAGKFEGTWSMASSTAFFLGTENAGLLPLSGNGVWSAEPK